MIENVFTLEDEPTTDAPQEDGSNGADEGMPTTEPEGQPEGRLDDEEKDDSEGGSNE